MITSMRDGELSLEQIQAFLEASQEVHLEGKQRREVYEWITRTLRRQDYRKEDKKLRTCYGVLWARWTGLSRAQVMRLVGRYIEHSEVKEARTRRHYFPSRFTRGDIDLLAKVDEAHETISGPATKRILEREFQQYKHAEYERLASISAAHI